MPKVTVLMPVYNGEKYLQEAIDSIINQTFTDFEFLIINDGSTDKSEEIIKGYQDERIRLINNEKNLKLIATLNKGLKLARGAYIARMDCDDISHPKRLEIQFNIMEKDNSIAVCGSSMEIIGCKYLKSGRKPTNPMKIRNYLYTSNCIVHPSVMIRKSIIEENQIEYQEEYIHAEDYQFFQSISENYKIINLRKPLLQYRLSPEGIGRKHKDEQDRMVAKISTEALSKIGIDFNRIKYKSIDKSNLHEIKSKLFKIYHNPNIDLKGSNKIGVIHYLWLDYCSQASNFGFWTIKEFWSFKPINCFYTDFNSILRLHIRCLFRR